MYVGVFGYSLIITGMVILCSSYVPLFEAVAAYCRLPFHFYLREVVSDGSVIGGVEIDNFVRDHVVRSRTRFIWEETFDGGCSLFDQAIFRRCASYKECTDLSS